MTPVVEIRMKAFEDEMRYMVKDFYKAFCANNDIDKVSPREIMQHHISRYVDSVFGGGYLTVYFQVGDDEVTFQVGLPMYLELRGFKMKYKD